MVMVAGLGTAGEAVAQDPKLQRLGGIRATAVVVESLPPEARGPGLTNEGLSTKVELKLRLAGLRVQPGSPWPYVSVQVVSVRPPYEDIYASARTSGSVWCALAIDSSPVSKWPHSKPRSREQVARLQAELGKAVSL